MHPNGGRIGSAAYHPEDAAVYEERGWVMVNGLRALIRKRVQPDEYHNVAFYIEFDEPYPHPHP